jgi:hypothetical protein
MRGNLKLPLALQIRTYRSSGSRDNVVGIATGYGLDDQGVGVRVHVVQTGSGVLYSGYPEISSGVKRPGREADHSPPVSEEAKKMWVYTTTHPYVFMA